MISLSAATPLVKASIHIGGSKSLSNRLLILNEILDLNLSFPNFSDSEDSLLLKKALEQLKNKKKETIDVHHAGTDMRFLTAYLATKEGEWILTGSDRMKQRPVGELVNALRTLGAEISFLEKENFPPLLINGKKLNGGKITIDSSVSSQFVSALLLIAPTFENGLELTLSGKTVSKPYIDMTLAMLRSYGIQVVSEENKIVVQPHFDFSKTSEVEIESDWSSASYWYSICALCENAEFELSYFNKESLQADSVLPEIYKNLGVKTEFKKNSLVLSSIKAISKTFEYDFVNCPDIAQTLAVTCFGLGIPAKLKGLATLKVKETDRILALKNELEKFEARVKITADTLELEPRDATAEKTKNVMNDPNLQIVRTYNDHRMAMSFAPLALLFKQIMIDDAAVVAKSYPAFWQDLKSVGFNVNLHA